MKYRLLPSYTQCMTLIIIRNNTQSVILLCKIAQEIISPLES